LANKDRTKFKGKDGTLCCLVETERLQTLTNVAHLYFYGYSMGAGIVPDVLDLSILDEVVPIHSETAMDMTHKLWMIGLPVGVSSGAIVSAATQVCAREESANKLAVCIIPSFGERYFTHPMFENIKTQAESLVKQPLPEPYDNTEFGFATPRG